MIELLVKYIQDKGYRVDVHPGYLVICKQVHDDICSISWGISKHVLIPELEECWYVEADKKMAMIDKAIAERYGDALANVAKEKV